LVIQFGAETTEVSVALRKLTRESKGVEAELKKVDRALKFSPGNTELLRQRQALLAKQIDNTTKRLDALKQAEGKLGKADIGSDKYNTLRREIIETTSKLSSLETKAKAADKALRVNPATIASIKSAGDALKKVGDKATSVGRSMTMGITVPIAVAGAAVLKFAMDAFESEQRFRVSTGNMANAIDAWSKRTASALSLNSYNLRAQAGDWFLYLKNFGLTSDAAAQMSEDLTMLAVDMASFRDISLQDAQEKLLSGMSGEMEAVRRWGIDLSDASIQLWALDNGLIKHGQQLTQNQKVYARYKMIMEQTSKAQGDWGRSLDAGSPAVKLKALQERGTELAVTYGQLLLPVMQKLTELGGGVAEWAGALGPAQKSLVVSGAAVAAVLGPAVWLFGSFATAASSAAGALVWVAGAAGGAAAPVAASGVAAEGAAVGFGGLATGATAAAATLGPLAGGLGILAALAYKGKEVWKQYWAVLTGNADELARLNAEAEKQDQIQRQKLNPTVDFSKPYHAVVDDQGRGSYANDVVAPSAQTAPSIDKVTASLDEQTASLTSGGAATQGLIRDIEGLKVAEDSVNGTVRTATESQLAYETALLNSQDAHAAVNKLKSEGKQGTDEYARALIAERTAELSLKDAKAASTEAMHAANVALVTGSSSTKTLTADQQGLVSKLDVATAKVAGLKLKLDTVPKSKQTELKAEIKQGEKNIKRLTDQIAGVKDKTITINVKKGGISHLEWVPGKGPVMNLEAFATGGSFAPGMPKLVIAGDQRHGYEHIIREDQIVSLMQRAMRRNDSRSDTGSNSSNRSTGNQPRQVIVNQSINQPVQSYSEMRRAVRDMAREGAW
jgi:hypothetical protein